MRTFLSPCKGRGSNKSTKKKTLANRIGVDKTKKKQINLLLKNEKETKGVLKINKQISQVLSLQGIKYSTHKKTLPVSGRKDAKENK